MNTHRKASAILKTELLKSKTTKTETFKRLSGLDVFTSSNFSSNVFSLYQLQKSTINRALVGLNTCNFIINSTTSNLCNDWNELTRIQFAKMNSNLANESSSFFQS